MLNTVVHSLRQSESHHPPQLKAQAMLFEEAMFPCDTIHYGWDVVAILD